MRRTQALLPVILLTAAACGVTEPETVRSSKARLIAQPSEADLRSGVAGNTDFALALYAAVKGDEDNVVYSPHSISSALAMTFAGARNKTESEMATALSFRLPQDKLHQVFNHLDAELEERVAEVGDSEKLRLSIVNDVWNQKGKALSPAFLDVLAEQYGAGVRVLDFVRDPGDARDTINDWIAAKTDDRIVDLLPDGSITSLTRLVLTNAIHLDADWRRPFKENDTRPGRFHTRAGGEVEVPFMNIKETFRHAQGEGWQAVELPYEGEDLAFLVLLPDAGRLDAFEASLDGARLGAIAGLLAPTDVELSLPKLEMELDLDLVPVLEGLGMKEAFTESADLSGIDGGAERLFISKVVHKAYLRVDEEGTEAAAATAVVVELKAAPPPGVKVIADRPFLFAIRDVSTGAILFFGRVADPS